MTEKYKTPATWDYRISDYQATDEQLGRWANDPNCSDQQLCAEKLAERLGTKAAREKQQAEEKRQMAEKRQGMEYNPFDARTEVSADARHIATCVVANMWIIAVVLPIVLGLIMAELQ